MSCCFPNLGYPSMENQQMSLEKFYNEIGVDRDNMCVEYIEAHSVGHPGADRDEVEALATLAGDSMEGPLYIGSVKSTTGHLMAASCKGVRHNG